MFAAVSVYFFFFNDTATTEIYTLSLHDALPISDPGRRRQGLLPPVVTKLPVLRTSGRRVPGQRAHCSLCRGSVAPDRKSTRLNSSHGYISYAVFCLKKKKKNKSPMSDKYDYVTI